MLSANYYFTLDRKLPFTNVLSNPEQYVATIACCRAFNLRVVLIAGKLLNEPLWFFKHVCIGIIHTSYRLDFKIYFNRFDIYLKKSEFSASAITVLYS
mgnify:CR=1 FL=1